jgi:sporulation protein YlmC with PRC-barrel domain
MRGIRLRAHVFRGYAVISFNLKNLIRGIAMKDYKIDGKYFRDRHGKKLGEVDGKYIRNDRGVKVAQVDGKYIRDSHGSRIGEFDGKYIRNSHGTKIGTIDDVLKIIDGSGGISLVALWMLFIS